MSDRVADSVIETMQQASMAEASSSQGVFDLLAGYLDAQGVLHTQVEVREITGYEEDMLASNVMPAHDKISALISRCTTRIGEVRDKGRIPAIVEELLVGDRIFLMFAIRRVSVGDDFPFQATCPSCKHAGIFRLNLGTDLETFPMPEPKKRLYERTLPSGAVVRFRPLCGKDEALLAKSKSKDAAVSLSMLLRVELLNGEAPTLAKVQSLSLRDRSALREAFEEIEGGIDTDLELQCSACGHEFEEQLDVGQQGFFFPSAVLKVSKKRSST